MKKIQSITPFISITALIFSILSLYFFANLQTKSNDLNQNTKEKSSIDFEVQLANIEVKTLVSDCADITWNSSPQPNNPAESIEYINKCIHMNASLQKTRELIEESDWSYWPSVISMPNDANDTSKFFFKHEMYPGVN